MGADAQDWTFERPPRPHRWSSRSHDVIVGHAALAVGNPGTPIPESWRWVPLADIAAMESGHTPSRSRDDWWGGEVPWIGITDARQHHGRVIRDTAQSTNDEGLANSASRLLPAGTVCISRTASIGYVVEMGRPMATSQDFVNWVPTPAVTSEWLRTLFNCGRATLAKFGKGSTHTTIYYPEWMSVHIALPPLVEQRAIVAKIESLFSELDQGVAQLEAVRRQLGRYRQSVLKAAFEGRLTAQWRDQRCDERRREGEAHGKDQPEPLPTADDLLARIRAERAAAHAARLAEWERAVAAWEAAGGKASGTKKPRKPAAPKDPPPLTKEELADLPELPEGWVWCRPEGIADFAPYALGIGPFGSNLKVSDYRDQGVPLIFVKNITSSDFTPIQYIESTKAEELAPHTVEALDIVITKMGDPPGDVAIYPHGSPTAVLTADCVKFRVADLHVNRRFIATAIETSTVKRQLGLMTKGVAQKKISLARFKGLALPLAPHDEQTEIVNEIDARLSVVDAVERTIAAALKQAEALRQSILKKAFEGRLLSEAELAAVRADPAYEPADQLLARIRESNAAAAPKKKTRRKRKPAEASP